ncbi:efflux RND transporter periplasmic adaptor subunit [Massilia sp. AB1]|uniref:efflux RND transporter periplasmic adaptor subunit n=1 Tax=Massilia sp. AB1 TaxID=2823371 RepID=UPI001E36E190|nr:HlyD family efflux transporter periplasmic adaptor subunit [Massilia sp. AB1]
MDRLPPHAVTGAAMDTVLPKRRGKLALRIVAAAAVLLVLAWGAWQLMPHGLQVDRQDLRIARAVSGVYRDDIVVRATAEPLNSIILDSVESGRVEEVFVQDGYAVRKGQLLFRLSNPQRNLELLERQAEHAQQISNLATLRVAHEAGRTDHQRRIADLEFALEQAQKQYARNSRLAAQGFISSVALEESSDKLAQQKRALQVERDSIATEERVRRQGLQQMETAIRGLQSGLQLVDATVDALAVRAPADGVLTDFRLQVGETVRPDQHIGRIDDPKRFKLTVLIDEFYLSRVAAGVTGSVAQGEQHYPVKVRTVFPQIREGRFTAELVFADRQPEVISPGQSLDARLTLGRPAQALMLPTGPWLGDSGGAWAFVLSPGGGEARRQPLQLGRRNNSQVEVLSGLKAGDQVVTSGYAPFGKAELLQLNP